MYPKLTRISYTARSSDLAVLLAFLACLAQTKAECLLAPARQVLLDTLYIKRINMNEDQVELDEEEDKVYCEVCGISYWIDESCPFH